MNVGIDTFKVFVWLACAVVCFSFWYGMSLLLWWIAGLIA